MARPATGSVIQKDTAKGTSFALRFRALGERQFILVGYESEGWTRARAEEELANVMADVRRGIWQPPTDVEPPKEVPTFHVFASEWLARREAAGLRPKSIEFLRWCLIDHLLPYFASMRLDAITIEEVDRYATAKVANGKLSNRSINHTLDTLSGVLEEALEYDHVARNVAKGRRRRLNVRKPTRSYLDRAEHIAALLDGASQLDRKALQRRGQRRALLATLVFAGLRIGEALDLRWRHVNLADGVLFVADAKTEAGVRKIVMRPVLRDELAGYRASLAEVAPNALVFATSTGKRQSETNVRRRILQPAVANANEELAQAEIEPMPERLTPHSLRRTFASVSYALGADPGLVMDELGHTDPALALRIYRHAMRRTDGEKERLRALVDGEFGHRMGTGVGRSGVRGCGLGQPLAREKPANAGFP
jgi:integrase